MKEVVTGGEFYLVVQGVGCRETVENSAIGHVNVGKGGELETVAHQFLGDTCCGKCGMAIDGKTVKAADRVFVAALCAEVPIIVRIPVHTDKGIVCVSAYHVFSNGSALRFAEIAGSLCAEDNLPDGQRAVGAEHRYAAVFPLDQKLLSILGQGKREGRHLVPCAQCAQGEINTAEVDSYPSAVLYDVAKPFLRSAAFHI